MTLYYILVLALVALQYTTAFLDGTHADDTLHHAIRLLAVTTVTVPTTPTTANTACMTQAVNLFQTAQNVCNLQFNSTNAAFTPQITTQLCTTNNCQNSMYAAFNSASACQQSTLLANTTTISGTTQPNMFAQAAQFVQGACVTSPTGQLCLPALLNITQQITTEPTITSTTQTQLQSLCSSSCYDVLTNTYNTMAINQQFVATTQLLCATNPTTNQLCLPQLQQIGLFTGQQLSGVMSNTVLPQQQLTQTNLPVICSTCGQTLLQINSKLLQQNISLPALQVFNQDSTDTITSALCTQSSTNTLCGTQLLQFNSTLTQMLAGPNAAQVQTCLNTLNTCTQQCAGLMQPLFQPLGCCAGTVLAQPAALSAMGLSADAITASATGLKACGVQTQACQAAQTVQSTLTLPNLNSTYAMQNQPAVIQALGTDISADTGAPFNSITLSNIQPATPQGTQVTVSIPAQSTTSAASIQAAMQQISNNVLPLTALSNLNPVASKNNINQPVTATVSNINSVNDSSATTQSDTESSTVSAAVSQNNIYTAIVLSVVTLLIQQTHKRI